MAQRKILFYKKKQSHSTYYVEQSGVGVLHQIDSKHKKTIEFHVIYSASVAQCKAQNGTDVAKQSLKNITKTKEFHVICGAGVVHQKQYVAGWRKKKKKII